MPSQSTIDPAATPTSDLHQHAHPVDPTGLPPGQIQPFVHELQVHQIELEMQNEELRRTQLELDAAREMYFDLYELAPIGYLTLSESGLILHINRTGVALLGLDRGQIVQQPLTRFIARDDQDAYDQHRCQLFETGEPQTYELRFLHQDGTLWWARVQANLARPGTGAPECRLTFSDITDQKQTEQALQKSEASLHAIFENSLHAFMLIDRDRHVHALNRMASEWVRTIYGHEIRPGDSIFSYMQPQTRAAADQSFEHVLAGESVQYEMPFSVGGRRQWYEHHLVPVRADGGHVTGVFLSMTDVTDRKRAEDALRASRDYLQAMQDAANDAIFVDDADTGQIIDVNQRMCEMYGYTREEALRTPIGDLSQGEPPYSQTEALAWLHKAREQGPQTFEWRAKRKDGQLFWAEVSIRFAMFGRDARFVVTVRDITERKQTEEQVRYQATLLANVNDAIVASDENYKLTAWNAAAESFYGWTAAEVLGRPGLEITQTDFPGADKGEMLRTIAATGRWRGEATQVRRDGTRIPVEVSSIVLHDDNGRVIGYVSANRDITKRKQAEEALRAERGLFVAGPTVVFKWKAQAGWPAEYVSPNVADQFGYTPEDLTSGQVPYVSIVHPDDLARVAAEVAAYSAQGVASFAQTYRIAHADGRYRWIDDFTTIIRGRDGVISHYLGYVLDITDRQRAEAALRESETRLRELNALQGFLLPPNPIEQKLKIITEAVVRIVGADFARIWMIRPGDRCATGCIHAQVTEGPHVCRFRDRCLHLLASSGRYTHTDGQDHGRVPFGCYKIGKVAAGEDPGFLTNDVTTDPRVHNHAWAKELGLVSFAGYRLVDADGAPLGVLALFSQHAISAEEDSLLEGIAHAVSHVLHAARAEAALRESELLYESLVEVSPLSICRKDLAGRFTFANQRFLETSNCSLADLVGRTDFELHPPELAVKYRRDDRAVMDSGQVLELIEERAILGGGPITIQTIKAPLYDAAGKASGVQISFWDITARIPAAEQAQRYEFIANTANECMTLINRQHLFETVNDAYCRAQGRSRAELIGHSLAEVWGETRYREKILPYLEQCFAGQIVQYEGAFPFTGDEPRNYQVGMYPYSVTPGDPVTYAVVVTLDITDVKRAERAEHEARQLAEALRDIAMALNSSLELEAVLDQILINIERVVPHDGATIMLIDGDVAYVRRRRGRSSTGTIGPERHPIATTYNLRTMRDTGEPCIFEHTRNDPNWSTWPGYEWIESYAGAPIRASDGRHIFGYLGLSSAQPGHFSADHAQRLKMFAAQAALAIQNAQLHARVQRYAEELEERVYQRTRQLTEANQQLAELDRLKDDFVSRISHELRTPLTSIKIYLELLENGKPEKHAKYMQVLTEQTARLQHLIESLLEVTQQSVNAAGLHIAPTDLNHLVTSLVSDLAPRAAQRGLTLTHTLTPDLPPASADAISLAQVLSKLATNALNYTPAGGTIELSTGQVIDHGETWITFTVRDSGPGIAPDELPHIFDRFYRGRAAADYTIPGAGLGLSISRDILTSLNGRLTAQSDGGPDAPDGPDAPGGHGHGATFTAWLKPA